MAKDGLSLEGFGIEQPYSMQAEQSVLGAAILDPSSIDSIVQVLRPEMFFVRQNRAVYTEMLSLITNSEPLDVVILADRLANDPAFPNAGDAKAYLAELAATVPSLSNLPYYTKMVQEKYTKRLLMESAREILEQANDDVEASAMLESAEQTLYEIRSGKDTTGVQKLKDTVLEVIAHLQMLSGPDRKKHLGIPSGFSYLDRVLTGFSRSDLIILASRPGMGKTSFALNIAVNVAKQNIPVIVYSLEMSKDQLASRILSAAANLDSRLFRTGLTREEDMVKLASVLDNVGGLPVHLDDTSSITIAEMRSKIRRINRAYAVDGQPGLGMVVIDYLQLMSSGRRTENRVQEISEMTRNLKIMAKDLNVPVLVLSQLSRSTEKGRAEHRPVLSDLRDSGSIEQDADIVMFLYRDGYYNDGPETDATAAECIVAKNRHGETTTVDMMWDGAHTRYYEAAPDRD